MSVDQHHLLIVFTAYVLAAGSPGPSNLRIMAVAMERGRKAGLTVAAGVLTGSVFWGLMAATGLSAILATSAEALFVLKVLGGLYLLYLAFKAGRSAMRPDAGTAPASGSTAMTSAAGTIATAKPGKLYRQGLLMHLANPKAVLGWMTIMTLGLGPGASGETVIIILTGCALLATIIFCGYAVLFSTNAMVSLYRRARRGIEATLALVFGLAALRLIMSRS